MKLLTKKIKKDIPPLYATEKTPNEDKKFVCKFFTPWSNWTWYILEGQQREGGDWEFFGYVEGLEKEYGYFVLSELESLDGPVGLKIERDRFFENVPVGKVVKQ